MRMWRRLAVEQDGQAMILVALFLVGMLGMLGLVIDGGRLMDERRLAQNAADAAAWAGAFRLQDGDAGAARADALAYAAQHGYDNDGVDDTVQVSVPPASGGYQGNSQYVRVTVRRQVELSFIRLVYEGASDVSATATAGVELSTGPYAIISLETSCATTGLETHGNNDRLQAINGGIMVNSCHPSRAMRSNGNGAFPTISGHPINVVGGYSGPPGAYSETPQRVPVPLPDPLRTFDPNLAAIYGSLPQFPMGKDYSGQDTDTLSPGVYEHIRIRGQAQITLNPGVYIIKGGDFEFAGQGSLVGHGVTIFLVNSSFPASGGSWGELKLTGQGNVDLTAPGGGDYQGLLLYQRTDGHIVDAAIHGNGNATTLQGTIYLPKADLTITGNGALTTVQGQLIARTIVGSGNASLAVDLQTPNVMKVPMPALVE